MNRFLCLIIIEIFSFCVYAQEASYEGIVCHSKSKQLLEFVSVCMLTKDSAVIDYTYTNEKGYFELAKIAGTGYALSFSCMGFKKVIIPLLDFVNASNLFLEEDVFKLQEVKISSNRIRQRKDTLIYSVSGFKMPQDRNIEDVLKKIPGIEVTQSGQIKFQDRPISNFYIDGMNLLDSKYALASKNIPASMVKEIQVLQSHQPIVALRDKSFSDNAALNLTLEDNAKNHFIGMADLGLGINQQSDLLWDNRLMGMLFGKKMQNLTMYKNNNIGEDISHEINALTANALEGVQQIDSEDDFFYTQPKSPKNIDRSRYLSNDAHLVSMNHLYKPQKSTDLRLQITALHDKQSASQKTETEYYYPSQTLIISEQENFRGQENRLEAEMSFIQNDSNVYLKNTLRGMMGLHKNELSLVVNGSPTNINNHPKRKLIQNNFHIIKNYNKHSISLYSNNSYLELPQYMTVTPGLFEDLLTGGQKYDYLQQDALLRTFKSDSYTYFQHMIGRVYLKYKAGVIYENRYLQSMLYADAQQIGNNDYSNKIRLETIEAYIEPSLNLKTEYWNLLFRIPLTYHNSQVKSHLPQTERQTKHCIFPTPSLNIKYNLNAYWTVSGMSTLYFIKPDIKYLYAGYLFNTYRTAQKFTQNLTYDKNCYNLLRVRYNNPLNGLFISLSGFFSQTWQENIYVYDNQESFLSSCHSTFYPNTKKFYGGSIRISKAAGWNKLFAALSASYNRQDDNIFLEDELIDSHLSIASIAADISLQPSQFINLSVKSKAMQIQSEIKLDKQAATKAWSYEHSLDINLIYSSKWRAKVGNFLTHDSQNKRLTYFSDVSVTYTKNRWLFELEAHNLFNHNQLNNIYLTDWTRQKSAYSLRPREFLLKTAFSF